jgi:hypothetical protein
MATKTSCMGMAKKRHIKSGRHSSLIGWVEILKADNIEESTTLEIEKTLKGYRPLQKDFQK